MIVFKILGKLLSKSVDIVNNIQIKPEECNSEMIKLIFVKFNIVISKNKGKHQTNQQYINWRNNKR